MTFNITNITIIGTIQKVGDDENGHPRIVVEDQSGNKVIFHVGVDEAKEAAKYLYEKCFVYFDAKVEISEK